MEGSKCVKVTKEEKLLEGKGEGNLRTPGLVLHCPQRTREGWGGGDDCYASVALYQKIEQFDQLYDVLLATEGSSFVGQLGQSSLSASFFAFASC